MAPDPTLYPDRIEHFAQILNRVTYVSLQFSGKTTEKIAELMGFKFGILRSPS